MKWLSFALNRGREAIGRGLLENAFTTDDTGRTTDAMEIRRTDKPLTQVDADWLIVPVIESAELSGPLTVLDQALSGW